MSDKNDPGGHVEPKPLPAWADGQRFQERLEDAVHSSNPEGDLITFVREIYALGLDEGEALGLLEHFRAQLREQDRATEEDTVMDVMDYITGHCSPHTLLHRNSPA